MAHIIWAVWYRQFGKIKEAQPVNLTVLAFVNHNMRSNLTVQADGKWYKTDFYLTILFYWFVIFVSMFFMFVGKDSSKAVSE